MNMADMLIEVYVAESILLRVEKPKAWKGEGPCRKKKKWPSFTCICAMEKAASAGWQAIYAFAEGGTAAVAALGLKAFYQK